MTPNQAKENTDGLFFLSVLLICAMVAVMSAVVKEAKARKAQRQQFVEQHLEYYVATSQYRKQAAGPGIFSWMPLNPLVDPSFVVEEKDGVISLVGVMPNNKLKDKDALKAVKKLYPGQDVVFHKDFAEVKKSFKL